MKICKVRKTYLEPRAWAWSFELLPLDVLESARVTEEEVPSSLIQKEEQRFGFLFGISGFLRRVLQISFISFDDSLSPKASPLKV